MNFRKLIICAFIFSLFFTSCSSDETFKQTPYVPLGDYDSGVLVLHQGTGLSLPTTLSYISFDLNTLENNILSNVNPTLSPGIFGQDIGLIDGKAYIVQGGSNFIQIVNRYSMQSIATISEGLNNPRYIVFSNGKAYVSNQAVFSDLTDDFISVYNLATNTLVGSIPVSGGSAEKMVVNGTKLYLAQGGPYGTGNKIQVIDLTNNTLGNFITVADSPNSMQIDNGILWVMCGGNSQYFPAASTQNAGALVKINIATQLIETSFGFSDSSLYPTNFTIFSSNAYYTIGSKVYKMALSAIALPTTPAFTSQAVSLNGFAVKSNHVYISDALFFDSAGKVYIYGAGTISGGPELGVLEKEHSVGVAPSDFYFNQ